MTGGGDRRKRIIEISGPVASMEAFLAEFREADAVLSAEPLTPLDAPNVFVALAYSADRWDSIGQRLTDMGVHYRVGTTITAGWERWTLYLDGSDDVDGIRRSLEAGGNDVRLVRDVDLGDVEGRSQLEFSRVLYEDLTPRQREVLAAAIDLGYYEKETSIEDIGDTLAIASSTAWEHLVRAEEKVMAEVGERLESRLAPG